MGAQTLDCRFYEGSLWSCVQTGAPVRIEAVDAERVRYRYVVAGTRSYVRTHEEFLQLFHYVSPLDEILRGTRLRRGHGDVYEKDNAVKYGRCYL